MPRGKNTGHRRAALCAVLAAAWALAGCMLAPGLSMGESLKQPPGPTQSRVVAGEGSTDAATFTPVTAELIRQQRASRPPAVPPQVQALLGTLQPYRIAPLDVLSIVLWGRPDFSPAGDGAVAAGTGSAGSAGTPAVTAAGTSVAAGYLVDGEGRIQLPFLGLVRAAGLTAQELRAQLEKEVARFFRNPMLTVRVQAYRGQRVYVSGEVGNKGPQPIDDVPMSLAEVLARAGGLTAAGDASAIALTRERQTTLLDLPRLAAAGVSPADVMLRNGDLVHVHHREESKVFVLGEVPRAGPLLLRNGRLSLNEALGESGGVNPGTGDPRQIYVIRHTGQEQVTVFHLDAKSAWAYALAEGFELSPRDVVYVDPVPLVNWNRVISLILPSAQAVTVTRAAATVAP
jgi:polysaccharide export outer membrane protein